MQCQSKEFFSIHRTLETMNCLTSKLLFHIPCNILMMILLTFVLCFYAFQETLGVLVSSRLNCFIFFLSFQDEGPCCLKGKLFHLSCNILMIMMILLAFVLCFSAFQETLGVQVSSTVSCFIFRLSFQDRGPCCLKAKLFLISCNILKAATPKANQR